MRNFSQTDDARFPIVLVTLNDFEPTLDEFNHHLDELTQLTSSQGVVLMLDISKSKFLPSEHRIAAGKWLKTESEKMKNNLKGLVFINSSVIMSVVLKGVFLVNKPPVDYLVASSLEEALRWANTKISM